MVMTACSGIDNEGNESSQVTGHGDIYSYGIVSLEIFAGKRPANGEGFNLHDFVEKALSGEAEEIADPVLFQGMEETEEVRHKNQI
ncbi:hypothetical protein EUGRSUZ_D00235 [Eucalyptus grandis]|uniref:Serine-threonine/tyrosine-protein kinase catalytic domain-containing protein n=1 Tax=Eucalyptus grandis TaxID=71139 RepID=A0A059CCE1_EUCGR|nr:hypothetical protein EUGRSUZ_D00235 [Eucalyptus grandis]